jgi:hypothetical protein
MAHIGRRLPLAGLLFLIVAQVSAQSLMLRHKGADARPHSIAKPLQIKKYGEDHPPVVPFLGVNWCGAAMPELGANLSILHGQLPSEPVRNARYSVFNIHLSGMLAIADEAIPAVRAGVFYAPEPAHFLTVGVHVDYFFHRDMSAPAIYPEVGLLLRPYPYKHYLETWKMPVFRIAYGYNSTPGTIPASIIKHVITLQVTTIGTVNKALAYKKG